MKKICIAFNHLQISDGVAKSAVAIANGLAELCDVEITLRPVFICEARMSNLLSPKVKVMPLFRGYFRGFSKLLEIIPARIIHRLIFGANKFDIEIGFQHGIVTESVVAGKKTNKRYIWIHGYDETLSLKNSYLKADKIVCVSKCNCDSLIKALDYKKKVEYAYNPINEKNIQRLGEENIDVDKDDSKLYFCSVGRHSDEKGYKRLLNVVSKLKKNGYNLCVWLIGDGIIHSELKEQARCLNITDCVYFLGEQINPHKFTAKADMFICSSYAEGYSTVCAEASILGIPVITTRVSGAEEIIESAQAGMIVDNNEEALYEGMKRILENTEMVAEWSKKLEATKKNFYSRERIEKIVNILELN